MKSVHHTRHGAERGPDEKRIANDRVDLDAHHAGGVLILGDRPHRPPGPGARDEQVNAEHRDQ